MTQAPAASPAPQIVARDLVKTYRMGDSVIGALQGIDVEVARGEYSPSPAILAPANRPS